MTPSNFPTRPIGGLAIAIGGVTLIGVVSLILFFTVGGGFGTLNDLCNGVEAILSAVLAWRIHPWLRSHAPRLSGFALIAAWVGALIAAIGSALIILDFTGWYLAGLYTMFGYALVGVWLFGLSYAALRSFHGRAAWRSWDCSQLEAWPSASWSAPEYLAAWMPWMQHRGL